MPEGEAADETDPVLDAAPDTLTDPDTLFDPDGANEAEFDTVIELD